MFGALVLSLSVGGWFGHPVPRPPIPVTSQPPISAAYAQRKAEYLAACSAAAGPGKGGLYEQICAVATGGGVNEDAIRSALVKINNREDTADFKMAAILRMLALYGDSPSLSSSLKAEMEDAVLNWKYWLDEPGYDQMCWWSENHQILFHMCELIAGQLYPDGYFTNSGMSGREHVEHALSKLRPWLDRRGTWGFSEWHSNIYFNEDIPALVNLADLAEDSEISTLAAMLLDVIAFDFASTYYQGVYATAHGRTYESTLIGGSNDSTREAAWLMLGLGNYRSAGNFSATFLATSPLYGTPALLESVARDASPSLEHRQSDSIDLADGPGYGISYTNYDDVIFWWGMGAYAAPETIEGTFYTVDYYDLWDGYFWSDVQFLKPLVGSPVLVPVAEAFEEMSAGSVLERMNTYVWRTPSYQLSGAQDFKPGYWGAQAHIWQATLDPDAVVFTSYPGGATGDYAFGLWTGGWLPRATFHKNVGIIQYQRPRYVFLDRVFFTEYTHAYFPTQAFDEVLQSGPWTLGRAGESYIGLYSALPTRWSTVNSYELIADGRENVWIVELGSAAENGTFDDFVEGVVGSLVRVGAGSVEYDSPSQGLISVSDDGPMTVGGKVVDLGPYPRFSNRYCKQEFDQRVTRISYGSQVLELDFDAVTRTVIGG